MALKTPIYDLKSYPNVYEPREDTFLFLDAIELEINSLKKLNPTFALEVGSGSGVVITALQTILKNFCAYFATDINLEACLATKHTATLNNAFIEPCRMNLSFSFCEKLFDLVLFNPPYVVTDNDELIGSGINRAWAGGALGRQVIDIFLQNLPNILSEKGVCYMVILKENNPIAIMEKMKTYNFQSEIVIERKFMGEHLYVLKLFAS